MESSPSGHLGLFPSQLLALGEGIGLASLKGSPSRHLCFRDRLSLARPSEAHSRGAHSGLFYVRVKKLLNLPSE